MRWILIGALSALPLVACSENPGCGLVLCVGGVGVTLEQGVSFQQELEVVVETPDARHSCIRTRSGGESCHPLMLYLEESPPRVHLQFETPESLRLTLKADGVVIIDREFDDIQYQRIGGECDPDCRSASLEL